MILISTTFHYVSKVSEIPTHVSSAAVYGPIVWPTEPFSSATEDFMANAVAAGYEDYNSDNEYLEHWLWDKDEYKGKHRDNKNNIMIILSRALNTTEYN